MQTLAITLSCVVLQQLLVVQPVSGYGTVREETEPRAKAKLESVLMGIANSLIGKKGATTGGQV